MVWSKGTTCCSSQPSSCKHTHTHSAQSSSQQNRAATTPERRSSSCGLRCCRSAEHRVSSGVLPRGEPLKCLVVNVIENYNLFLHIMIRHFIRKPMQMRGELTGSSCDLLASSTIKQPHRGANLVWWSSNPQTGRKKISLLPFNFIYRILLIDSTAWFASNEPRNAGCVLDTCMKGHKRGDLQRFLWRRYFTPNHFTDLENNSRKIIHCVCISPWRNNIVQCCFMLVTLKPCSSICNTTDWKEPTSNHRQPMFKKINQEVPQLKESLNKLLTETPIHHRE